jgi:hypothetical protein
MTKTGSKLKRVGESGNSFAICATTASRQSKLTSKPAPLTRYPTTSATPHRDPRPPRSQLEPSRVEIESLNGILLSFNDITDRAVRGAGVTDQPRRNDRQCLNIFARPLTAGTNCANAYTRCACQTLSAPTSSLLTTARLPPLCRRPNERPFQLLGHVSAACRSTPTEA